MRILLDTNIVLDAILNREPFVRDSRALWMMADDGAYEGSIAAFSLSIIHYVCRRHAGKTAADAAVDLCLEAFEVCALYRECILAARRMKGADFEDNLQLACAVTDFSHGMVTRGPKGYVDAPIRIYSPSELLREVRGKQAN
jgi:predicted nucleic acid-binding protein